MELHPLAMLPEARAPPQARLFDWLHDISTVWFAAPFGGAAGRLLAGYRELGCKRLKTGASRVSWRRNGLAGMGASGGGSVDVDSEHDAFYR